MQIKGLHLDPARRRLSLEKVLEIIEQMSKYGLNTLHLHLTDDQGIGLDIETLDFYESNGWTINDQIIIADMCEKLGIDIIPEINIPGHTVALRSLLEEGTYSVDEKMGIVTHGLLREEDLPTILEIFDELCHRFKVKKYIHMGGDETRGASKSYFQKITDDVCQWAEEKNLSVIAWEDILAKVEDLPDNIIIQKWKHRTFPLIAQGLKKLGPKKIIYSANYYLDTSPDPFTMYRKSIEDVELGCIACTWGELIGMENIDGILHPSIILLASRWNGSKENPVEILKKYRSEMIYPEIRKTWKRRQWTGYVLKEDATVPPRSSSSVTINTVLNRIHDRYPICSKLLIDMTIDIYDAINSSSTIKRTSEYKKAFLSAGADEKSVNDLFKELRGSHPTNIKLVKTILRRIQRSQEAEEQLLYKNGLRMVVRELLRIEISDEKVKDLPLKIVKSIKPKMLLFYGEKDPYYQFSNFYLAEITVEGIKYLSTEYYYQAQKFMGPDASVADLAYAKKIRSVNTSNKAYYLAKQIVRGGYAVGWYVSATDKTLLNDLIKQSHKDQVKVRDDWDIVKDNVMRKAVWAKFTQHKTLKDLLISTDDAYLAEDSPRDAYWGLGKDGDGENMLGRVLDEVRTFLIGKFPTPPTVTSNWVVPEFVLASAYPGAADLDEHEQVVDSLVNAPINLILSLQEAREETKLNSYRKVIAPKFQPSGASFCEKVWSARYKRPIILARTPIKDRSVVSDNFLDVLTDTLIRAVGKHFQLLIHCLGGKGRTGTVIAVMLGKMYGMTADQALTTLSDSFSSRVLKGVQKPGMPQTKAQFAQVRRLLSPPKYKLAIVGSRDFTDYKLLTKVVNDALQEWNIKYSDLIHIVSGGATGADALAAKFAAQHDIPLKEYLPDWDTHGKAAGPIRNKAIIADATHVIAFPSTTGKGTQNSISLAKKAALPLRVVNIDKVEPLDKAPPTVVCIKKEVLTKEGYKDLQDWLDQDPNHMYIGRNMTFYVPGAVGSKWKNPYVLKKYSLEESLELYEQHIRGTPALMAALPDLGGKVLGCWCKGSSCHGDILVKLYNEVLG